MTREILDPENLTGPQKAAVLLLTMGKEFTTAFFKELDQKSIQKIGRYMSEIDYVSSDVLHAVMNDFLNSFENELNLAVSGKDFLKDVVSETLDEDAAREVFEVMGENKRHVPFSDLIHIPTEQLVNLLKGEHPQTIALVLSYLPQEKAAETLGMLPEGMNADIALRIAKIGQVQDELVIELDETIRKDLAKTEGSTRKFDGVLALANILNQVDGTTEESVIAHIEEEDPALAEMIRQKMFVFEDLLQVEDKSFREILQNVDNQTVAKALKTASEEMKEKIFGNLSERASEMLREDIEVMGPVRLREVEEAQQEIIRVAKKLESDGRIVLAGKGKEDILV
jgi:flagellar motor switch protein FliG